MNASDPAADLGKGADASGGKALPAFPEPWFAMKGGNPIAVMERQGKHSRFRRMSAEGMPCAHYSFFCRISGVKHFAGLETDCCEDYP